MVHGHGSLAWGMGYGLQDHGAQEPPILLGKVWLPLSESANFMHGLTAQTHHLRL